MKELRRISGKKWFAPRLVRGMGGQPTYIIGIRVLGCPFHPQSWWITISNCPIPDYLRRSGLGWGRAIFSSRSTSESRPPISEQNIPNWVKRQSFQKCCFLPSLRAQWPQGLVGGGGRMKVKKQKDVDSNPTSNNYLLIETQASVSSQVKMGQRC